MLSILFVLFILQSLDIIVLQSYKEIVKIKSIMLCKLAICNEIIVFLLFLPCLTIKKSCLGEYGYLDNTKKEHRYLSPYIVLSSLLFCQSIHFHINISNYGRTIPTWKPWTKQDWFIRRCKSVPSPFPTLE